MQQTHAHDIVIFENGQASLRSRLAGEAMHSSIGPWEEAQSIYIARSGLLKELSGEDRPTWVLFDIGLGIAANALASIEACGRWRPKTKLHLVSFENELDGLEFALEEHRERGLFPFMKGYEAALGALLERGVWETPHLRWELRRGDYLENLEGLPAPDTVFFDLFSPKSSPDDWGIEGFRRIFLMGGPTRLVTYSAATSVRSALLLAGFKVGRGAKTELKSETTVAVARGGELEEPLGGKWLSRLERSSRPLPPDWSRYFDSEEKALRAVHEGVLR